NIITIKAITSQSLLRFFISGKEKYIFELGNVFFTDITNKQYKYLFHIGQPCEGVNPIRKVLDR
ncbi:MAG: hypothetical protein RAO94_09455, partial [Candidatus Stygibacter australis]|nr:hypothetical protein [Candidatus Stygibacter australis]